MSQYRGVYIVGLLLCLGVGGYLRIVGYDWGYDRDPEKRRNDGPGYCHPDERSVYGKTAGLRWDRIERKPDEGFGDYQVRAARKRYFSHDSGLNINSFNYGSLPYYVLMGISAAGNEWPAKDIRLKILYLFVIVVLIRWLYLFGGALFFARPPPTLLGFLGEFIGLCAVYGILYFLAGEIFQPPDPHTHNGILKWEYGSWALLGRPLSGLAGALTILYVYRIGGRLYNRRVGLLAAILLTFTALHIQLSHYYTFDIIQTFLTAAAVYSLLVFVDAKSWSGRWRAILTASIWAGLGMATKFGAILFFLPWAVALGVVLIRSQSLMGLLHLISLLILSIAWAAGSVSGVLMTLLVVLSVNSLILIFNARTPTNLVLWVLLVLVQVVVGVATFYVSPYFGIFWSIVVLCCLIGAWQQIEKLEIKSTVPTLHLAIIAVVSFLVIWAAAFVGQPFGYLNFKEVKLNPEETAVIQANLPEGQRAPTTRTETELSFVHFDFSDRPRDKKEGAGAKIREVLKTAGDFLHPYTSALGFHFSPHYKTRNNVPILNERSGKHEDRISIGGSHYWRDVTEQRRMALTGGRPFTVQYKNTVPFLYQWNNMIWWGVGPPLGILFLLGIMYGFGRPFYQPSWKELVVWAWMIVNFVPIHLFHTKFLRYQTPLLPFYCLWAAALCIAAIAWLKARHRHSGGSLFPWHRLAGGTLVLAMIWSAYYSLGYSKIYTADHTWAECSKWFDGNTVAKSSKVLTESWDDEVPWDGRVRSRKGLRGDGVNPVHSDGINTIQEICRKMARTDYYCFSSKRNYGAFLQAPEDHTNRNKLYKALYAGNLGFELVKTFSQPVYVFGMPIRFELADESLSLYDHPTVHIFKNVKKLPAEEIEHRIFNPPDWVGDLTRDQILTATEHRSIFSKSPDFAIARWLIGLFVLGWLLWPITFMAFRSVPDGGMYASKTMGLVLLAYLSWLGASVGWWPNARWATFVALILLLVISWMCGRRAGGKMAAFLKANWLKVILSEIIFLVIFGYFLGIRLSNPDIHWGEKPMDASFVNAVYQSESFPAPDPWYAGVKINYYYYGHVIVGIFGRFVGVSPDAAYNLAAATWPALVFCLVFGVVFNLTRSRLGGLIGGFLASMAGNGKSFFQLTANIARREGSGSLPAEPKTFREGYSPHDGLGGYFADAWDQISAAFAVSWTVIRHIWSALAACFDPSKVEEAANLHLPNLMGFDNYFWKLSRINRSTVANEFPMWSAVFADLHAHLLVMPLGVLFISLVIAYCKRKAALWEGMARGESSCAKNESGGSIASLAQLFLLAVIAGAIWVTNTWDLPGCAILFLFATVRVLLKERQNYFAATQWTGGRAIIRMGLWGRRLRGLARWKMAFLQEVFLPVVGVFLLARALYYPFHQAFQVPERMGGLGMMHEAASGWLTPYEFLQIFGFFVPIILVGLASYYWRWTTSVNWGWLKATFWTLGSLAFVITLAWFLRSLAGSAFDSASLETMPPKSNDRLYYYFMDRDIAYVVAAFVTFLLLLVVGIATKRSSTLDQNLGGLILILGLAIVAGCEFFYIIEGGRGTPGHRWNTLFKFHLQAWLCLSIGCGWLLGLWWTKSSWLTTLSSKFVGRSFRYVVGYPVLAATLLGAGLFPMVAPYIFSAANGFHDRTRGVTGNRSVDGLHYLRVKEPDVTATIGWLRTHIEGTPTVAEAHGYMYHHDHSRISTHTGLPTLVGWDHHCRERGNLPEPRIAEARKLYTSTNREQIRKLLQDHQVKYVVVGPTERQLYSSAVKKGIPKFDDWSDLFTPVFHSEKKPPGVTVYKVDPSYRLDAGWEPPPQEESRSHFVEDKGPALLRGGKGFNPGEYDEPRAIVVAKSGQTYVADTMNHRIQSYDKTGRLLWWLGEEGEEIGYFKEPNDVDVDEAGNLYVLDTWNARVQIFSPTGELKHAFSWPGFGPRGIAVGKAPLAKNVGGEWVIDENSQMNEDIIYVADTGHKQVVAFNQKGKQAGVWVSTDVPEDRLAEPVDVEITPMGVAVSDAKNRRIVIYDGRGRYLNSWEVPTEPTDNITNEMHLAWDEKGTRLLISDPENNRLWALSEGGGKPLKLDIPGGPTGIDIAPNGQVYVTLRHTHKIRSVPLPNE